MVQKPKGRATRLNEEKTREVCAAIAKGNTHDVSASVAGIPTSTFYYWLKRGREAKSGKMRNFYDRVKQAEAVAEAKRVEIIRQAGEGTNKFEDNPDWKAAAWYLERRYPEKWGRKHLTADFNHSGEVVQKHETETRIEITQKLESDPESQDLLQKLYERSQGIK